MMVQELNGAAKPELLTHYPGQPSPPSGKGWLARCVVGVLQEGRPTLQFADFRGDFKEDLFVLSSFQPKPAILEINIVVIKVLPSGADSYAINISRGQIKHLENQFD
jgi:hypothetical protein